MLNLTMNDDGNFSARLLKAQAGRDNQKFTTTPPELCQWLEYWNDADSVAGNLRKVEHWLQRARQQTA